MNGEIETEDWEDFRPNLGFHEVYGIRASWDHHFKVSPLDGVGPVRRDEPLKASELWDKDAYQGSYMWITAYEPTGRVGMLWLGKQEPEWRRRC
ncbi:MAG: hypothetical protein LAT55_12875 [Opitutales bacterium]|nr:hypothetical protein [Opitutales bacterium]